MINRYLSTCIVFMLFLTACVAAPSAAPAAAPMPQLTLSELPQQSMMAEPIIPMGDMKYQFRTWIVDDMNSIIIRDPVLGDIEWNLLGRTSISQEEYYVSRQYGIFMKQVSPGNYPDERLLAQAIAQETGQLVAFDDVAYRIYTPDAGQSIVDVILKRGTLLPEDAAALYKYEELWIRLPAKGAPITSDRLIHNWMVSPKGTFAVTDFEGIIKPGQPGYPVNLFEEAAVNRARMQAVWTQLGTTLPGQQAMTYEEALAAQRINPSVEALVKSIAPDAALPGSGKALVTGGAAPRSFALAPSATVDDVITAARANGVTEQIRAVRFVQILDGVTIAVVIVDMAMNELLSIQVGEQPIVAYHPMVDPGDQATNEALVRAGYYPWIPFWNYRSEHTATYYWDTIQKRASLGMENICTPIVLADMSWPIVPVGKGDFYVGQICPESYVKDQPNTLWLMIPGQNPIAAFSFQTNGAPQWVTYQISFSTSVPGPGTYPEVACTLSGIVNADQTMEMSTHCQ